MKKYEYPKTAQFKGALPVFEETVGRPNMGRREAFIRYAGDIFYRRSLSDNGPMMRQPEERVADVRGVKLFVAMSNGTVVLEVKPASHTNEYQGKDEG